MAEELVQVRQKPGGASSRTVPLAKMTPRKGLNPPDADVVVVVADDKTSACDLRLWRRGCLPELTLQFWLTMYRFSPMASVCIMGLWPASLRSLTWNSPAASCRITVGKCSGVILFSP